MKKRTLRRKVIIREYDFNKVREQAFAPLSYIGITDSLYDRASFTAINRENLERLKVEEILRGKSKIFENVNLDLKMPALLVAQFRDHLYNEKYYQWKITIDDEGYLCVQSRKNTPKSRLGWAIFEKDLESRL